MSELVRISEITAVINNHILAWSRDPSLSPLAQILRKDRKVLSEIIFFEKQRQPLAQADALRAFILRYALERVRAQIDLSHFVLFKEDETVQVILEDSFGVKPGVEWDEVTVPHQREAIQIIIGCLFGKRIRSDGLKDLVAFLQLFSRHNPSSRPDQDRVMRYKSMVWMVYLAITVGKVEENISLKGIEFLSKKFRELLDHSIKGDIINEDSRLPGFDGGKWEKTLFGWLQGEDRKPFLLKLARQFNLDNKMEHANRRLLAEHRKCIFEQVLAIFG